MGPGANFLTEPRLSYIKKLIIMPLLRVIQGLKNIKHALIKPYSAFTFPWLYNGDWVLLSGTIRQKPIMIFNFCDLAPLEPVREGSGSAWLSHPALLQWGQLYRVTVSESARGVTIKFFTSRGKLFHLPPSGEDLLKTHTHTYIHAYPQIWMPGRQKKRGEKG